MSSKSQNPRQLAKHFLNHSFLQQRLQIRHRKLSLYKSLVPRVQNAYKDYTEQTNKQIRITQISRTSWVSEGLYSTTQQMQNIKLIIQKSNEYNIQIHIAFIDYSKAFDSIELWAVFQAMNNARIDSRYKNF